MSARTLGIICFGALCSALPAQVPAKVDFARDVQPIFREHCLECHGPSQQMRGLRLDRRRDVMPNRVGANGARVVPGSSERSPLFRRVRATDRGQVMPPTGAMPAGKIEILKAWIDQGAEWPDALSGDRDLRPADPTVVAMRDALRNADRAGFARALAGRPEAVNSKGSNGWTPLMYAALYGDELAVRSLLEKGANPNAQNDDGGTALMYATDDEGKTRALLERGANPNLRSSEGRTALLIASRRPGSIGVVKALIEKGADASVRMTDGRSALSQATLAGDPAVVKLLVEHGVKKPVALGPALLFNPECFDILLPSAEQADLTAGLQGAVRAGDLARLHRLLDLGAQPATTLLSTVALMSPPVPIETVRKLMAAGAKGEARTAELARRQGNLALLEALGEEPAAAPEPPRGKPAASARAAVERAIPLLQRADVAFLDRAGCVSCHNNSLTAMMTTAARGKGVRFDEQIAKDQLRKIAAFLEATAERALENEGVPGGIDTTSYMLLGMAAGGYPGDPITDAWARHVRNSQAIDGRWRAQTLRPPLESSDFEVTAASIRSLRTYGPKSRRADYDQAVARGVKWLESARPASNEDRTFQLLGLSWGGGSRQAIQAAARELVAQQRPDGGWSQIPAIGSDAYATGQALVALQEAKAVSTESDAYRRGVQFLMNSQLEDGSWHVVSRAIAIQPYFDSDFPHGADQFISAAASNWAAMALIHAIR